MPLARQLLSPLLLLGLLGCRTTGGGGQLQSSLGADAKAPVVTTSYGQVQGVGHGTWDGFFGLPYAKPPVGALRWSAPQPPSPWVGMVAAAKPSAPCPQPASAMAVVGPVNGTPPVGSEDCLYLNVYRPAAPAANLPVLVFLHGGGFLTGSGSEHDGSSFASTRGLIVVTLNYRLGALGFLAHPALTQEDGKTAGNYGLADQQAALRWVQHEIAAFGGDPQRVTLFGQSAGGYSTCDHLASPPAVGLFQRAIIASGACEGSVMMPPRSTAEQVGVSFQQDLGCGGQADAVACLRGKDAGQIVQKTSSTSGAYLWSPSYGSSGDALIPLRPDRAFRSGQFHHMPVINGTTHDEANAFALMYALTQTPFTLDTYHKWLNDAFQASSSTVEAQYPASSNRPPLLAYAAASTDYTFSCRAQRLNGVLSSQIPVYAYEFADPHPASMIPPLPQLPQVGAFHTSELVYIFQAREAVADPSLFTPEQKVLSDQMAEAWASFVKNGQPTAAPTAWPAFTAAEPTILQFAPGGSRPASAFSTEHNCAFWGTIAP